MPDCHVMVTYTRWSSPHAFQTLALDGIQRLVTCGGKFVPEDRLLYQLVRRPPAPQNRPENSGEGKNPSTGVKHRPLSRQPDALVSEASICFGVSAALNDLVETKISVDTKLQLGYTHHTVVLSPADNQRTHTHTHTHMGIKPPPKE
jgi:hypothetical protein